MQTTPKPISTKSPRKTKNAARFLLDWAAVIALALCFIVFTLIKGSRFMSFNNMINILRAMSITTVFGIAATVTMAPDGFDMSACTLASCSAYVFVSMYLWYGLPLFACVLITIAVTLIMYQLTMFLILVCKIPDMLATCALMFVHQGLGQWYIGGGAVSTGMRLPSGAQPVRTKLEDSFSAIGREPWLIIIMLVCVLIAHIFLEYTKHGRFIYAMGGNKQREGDGNIQRQQAGGQAERHQRQGIPLSRWHDYRCVRRHRRHPRCLPRQLRAGHVLR